MIRNLFVLLSMDDSWPRTSGDDPADIAQSVALWVLAPHERG